MKDDKPADKNTKADPAVNGPTTGKPRNKQNKQPGRPQKKSQKGKKKSFLQVWSSYSRFKQAEFLIAVLAALGVIGYLIAYIVVSNTRNIQFREEHGPLIVQTKLDFLQTYRCVPAANSYQPTGRFAHGDFYIGNIDKTYKNIGNMTAYDVSGLLFERYFARPVKPTGIPFYDRRLQVSTKDCATAFRLPGSPLEPGREDTIRIREAGVGVPPQVQNGDLVTFDYETCTTYADRDGKRHGTCDLYSLYTRDVANLPSVDKILGTPELPCDGMERTAHFVSDVGGHCQD